MLHTSSGILRGYLWSFDMLELGTHVAEELVNLYEVGQAVRWVITSSGKVIHVVRVDPLVSPLQSYLLTAPERVNGHRSDAEEIC